MITDEQVARLISAIESMQITISRLLSMIESLQSRVRVLEEAK